MNVDTGCVKISIHLFMLPSGPSLPAECSSSYVRISEGGRSRGEGRWCGERVGTNLYYSESDSVTVHLVTVDHTVVPSLQIR